MGQEHVEALQKRRDGGVVRLVEHDQPGLRRPLRERASRRQPARANELHDVRQVRVVAPVTVGRRERDVAELRRLEGPERPGTGDRGRTREGRVVVLDFGLVTEASAEDRSTGNAVVGTPAYMAPEQAASRELGPAADVYAVGVMLYEILTGRLPIEGAQLQMLLDKQTREPPAPSSIAASVPDDLNMLCVRMLRFDPPQRPAAADVLRQFDASSQSFAELVCLRFGADRAEISALVRGEGVRSSGGPD